MTVGERATEVARQLRHRWSALPAAQRRLALLSVAAFLLLGVTSLWWSTRTDWRTLFRDLDGRDTALVQQELAGAGIAFETSADGTAIQVAAENLDKARVSIAAKGMPQSGRLGFELFDKPNWAGSEFDERVNYQRALEGELEHTLASMDAVRAARVHLVLPVHGAFSNEDQPAKASVVLTLRRTVDAQAVGPSMRALVASAVEGLSPAAVTLVDADARVNFSGQGDGRGAAYAEEAALQQKLIALLEPLAGAGNVRATVNLSYHTGSEERTDDVYDPNGSVPLTTQRTEQTVQGNRSGGVAGAASNTPALAPAPAQPAAAANPVAAAPAASAVPAPAGTATAQLSREESSSFAVSRHTSHSEEGPGRIRRITAAIVINDRATADGSGKHARTTWHSRGADEMKRLQQIAQAAVGFESARGDEVVVQNVAFQTNAEEGGSSSFDRLVAQGKDLLRSQPSLLRSIAVGASMLLLGLLVLRPLGRQAVSALALPAPLPVVDARVQEARIHEAQVVLDDPRQAAEEELLAAVHASSNSERLLQQVNARIQAEPRGSARLVESWLSSGSGAES